MLGKLIIVEDSRGEAISTARAALRQFDVKGVPTTGAVSCRVVVEARIRGGRRPYTLGRNRLFIGGVGH